MRTHKIKWPTATTAAATVGATSAKVARYFNEEEHEITWKVEFKLTHYCMHCISM